MNHLAHFKLAMGEPHLIAGALLGDQIKGRLVGRLDRQLELGIRLHREIDGYTDAHAVTTRSCQRLQPPFRRYAPILVDLIYDHILASQWHRYHAETLEEFTRDTFAALTTLDEKLPERTAAMAHRMEESGILHRYRELNTIAGALRSISGRLSRPNPVGEALTPLRENLDGLRDDFSEFFPDLERFVNQRLQKREYQPLAVVGSGIV